ncbi:hypothetical protein [Streptomyces sp. NPDC048581]|uniref:hypothetical protein n=1 Tax=unclassified Streptomyces TaxID=2593676 RepID=UPI003711A314
MSTFNVFGSMIGAMEIVFLVRVLHVTPAGVGLVFSGSAVGGMSSTSRRSPMGPDAGRRGRRRHAGHGGGGRETVWVSVIGCWCAGL